MLYFDTHAHYDWKEFDKDRIELFEEFGRRLCGLVNIGINVESVSKVIEYAKKYSYMYYSIGIHPMEVEKNFSINSIEQIIKNELENKSSKLVAIGETGLDYHFDYPIELQREYFIEQIKLANKYSLPIIIHSRESQEDVEKILRENPVIKTGIMHCYSGTPEMSKKFIEMGYYLGVGGPVTRYKDIQETVKITPINRIVIETDSPVLPPEPFEKHSRNNSLYLNYIVSKIAEIKGLTENEVVEHTTQNAYKIYGINMTHQMRLKESPFERIKNGTKTVEFRLYDEKRRKVKIGDKIEFSKLPDLQEKIIVEVQDIYKAETFETLFRKIYNDEEEIYEKAKSMLQYYSHEQEKEYGVLGIKIKLIEK